MSQTEMNPKFRNVHDAAEAPEQKPEGADKRLIIGAVAIFICVLVVSISGIVKNSALSNKLAAQNEELGKAKAEALQYGITIDEDGDLVLPEKKQEATDVAELDWDSIEQRNQKILESFTKTLLNWNGTGSYQKVRETFMEEWEFAENSQLLTSFMPEVEELDTNISFSGNPQVFVLSDDGKDVSYFLICTVRTMVENRGHDGVVGIEITINEDGTISNVSAQTLRVE